MDLSQEQVDAGVRIGFTTMKFNELPEVICRLAYKIETLTRRIEELEQNGATWRRFVWSKT